MVKNGKTKRKYHKPTKPHHHSSPPPAQDKNPSTVKTLPAHLLLEILYRTPVKSLVRFQCVSKSWFALITHPTFVQLHLEFNTSRNKLTICNISCDKKVTTSGDYSRKLIALVRATEPPIPLLRVDRHFTNRPNYPKKINFLDFSKNMILAGSINGIVCLSHYKEMLGRFVALWNPGINYWNPIALTKTKFWGKVSVGLGFDAVKSDYKIICIVPDTRLEYFGWSRVEIYSTNQGSWENVDGKDIFPFYANLPHCNFIVQGVPYWMGTNVLVSCKEESAVLGRIDPFTGLYKKVMYPRHVMNKSTRVNPVKWRDSVSALIQSPGEYPNQMVDFYVLDENTTKWTKMFSIGPLVIECALEHLRIPQCLSTGEIVLEMWTETGNIVTNVDRYFCDPKTDIVFRNNEIEMLAPFWFESYSHVESLVCVKGMLQIGKEHKDKKRNPKMKNWSEFLSKEFESVLHL